MCFALVVYCGIFVDFVVKDWPYLSARHRSRLDKNLQEDKSQACRPGMVYLAAASFLLGGVVGGNFKELAICLTLGSLSLA